MGSKVLFSRTIASRPAANVDPGSAEMFRKYVRNPKYTFDLLPFPDTKITHYYDADPNAVDKTYSKRGAFLQKVPFDPMEFGMAIDSLRCRIRVAKNPPRGGSSVAAQESSDCASAGTS